MPAAELVPVSNPSEKIIVALDVDSADEARRIVDELTEAVGAFKIGLQLFTKAGPDFVRELSSAGHRIFLDLKLHDIPNTVANAGVEAAKLGVWMFNVHALGGAEMMRRTEQYVAEFCEREAFKKPKIIAVTVLTSSDANELHEVGIEHDVENLVVSLAQLTAKCGLDGVVASPREASAIKSDCGEKFLVVTPGIRAASETFDDQKRVNTAAGAVEAGSDYLVIGRPITKAADRRQAAIQIVDEIAHSTFQVPD
jgi:orotidine-5'-phosphate decarboxylase